MAKTPRSEFESYIISEFGPNTARYIHEQLIISAHAVTKAYKDPKCASNLTLLAFAKLLEKHPYELIEKYDLGKDKLAQLELEYYKTEYKLNYQTAESTAA